jgi:uncharacterized protein YndB with AHSA1/START domain
MNTGDKPVIVEQIFDNSSDVVWNSITEIEQMRQWFFENIPSFEPEVGFETQFNVKSQDRNFLHMWRVTEVVHQKKITYDWKYEGYPGDSTVVFELFEQDDSTKLRLTHHVKESFPEDIPEFTRDSCVEGWTFFIRKSLKTYLEKRNR